MLCFQGWWRVYSPILTFMCYFLYYMWFKDYFETAFNQLKQEWDFESLCLHSFVFTDLQTLPPYSMRRLSYCIPALPCSALRLSFAGGSMSISSEYIEVGAKFKSSLLTYHSAFTVNSVEVWSANRFNVHYLTNWILSILKDKSDYFKNFIVYNR